MVQKNWNQKIFWLHLRWVFPIFYLFTFWFWPLDISAIVEHLCILFTTWALFWFLHLLPFCFLGKKSQFLNKLGLFLAVIAILMISWQEVFGLWNVFFLNHLKLFNSELNFTNLFFLKICNLIFWFYCYLYLLFLHRFIFSLFCTKLVLLYHCFFCQSQVLQYW